MQRFFAAVAALATMLSCASAGIAANIGGGVLKRFTVTFDYAHQTMSLVPNAQLSEPDAYEHSRMFVINAGKVVVAAVRPGTPAAEAGIVKGDVIESIDGVQGAQLTLGAAPRTITLTLREYV